MEPQIIIARRIARELSPGMLVNLGIGIPTLVANHVPSGMQVFFQSENGLIGTGSIPEEGMAHPMLTDAARSGRTTSQLDDSQQNGARHGRSYGFGLRCETRHRGYAAHRQGFGKTRKTMHVAHHVDTSRRFGGHRIGSNLVSRWPRDADRDRSWNFHCTSDCGD